MLVNECEMYTLKLQIKIYITYSPILLCRIDIRENLVTFIMVSTFSLFIKHYFYEELSKLVSTVEIFLSLKNN